MGGDAISLAGYLHGGVRVYRRLPRGGSEISQKGEKYRALRQVDKARRLVKRYEFLISPRMSAP